MTARTAGSAGAVSRNTASLLGARVLAQLLAMALTVLLAARIGLAGFGEYAFVNAIVFVGGVITTFGTDMVLIRDVAGRGRVDRCAAALALQLALSALAIAVVVLVTATLPARADDLTSALRLLSLSLLPGALFSVCTAALRGRGLLRAYAGVTVLAAAAPLAGAVALVGPGASVTRAVTVLVTAQLGVAAVAWAMCAAWLPEARVVSRVSLSDVVSMARASASIGVLGVLGVAYQRCGAIFVTVAAGPAATGWFAGASRVVEASKTGHVALFTAAYPAMAEAHGGRAANREGLDWSRRLCLGGAAVVSAALLLVGPGLVGRLYGPAFAPASTGLAILALAVVPSTFATYQSLALLAADRARATLGVLSTSLAVLVAATAALIPVVGWTGACWATLIADTTNAALMTAARAGARPSTVRPGGALAPAALPGGYR